MKNKSEELKIRKGMQSAEVSSFNEETNEIDLIVSTGQRGKRWSWNGTYFEELEISERAIRLERFGNGAAPVLKDHRNSIERQIGVVVKAWVEGANLMAKVRLSDSDEDKGLVEKIKSGIIRNVSVGYNVHKYEEQQVEEGETPIYRAVDWEPAEVSFVAIPFDYNAKSRNSEEDDFFNAELIKRKVEKPKEENKMDPKTEKKTEVNVEEIRKQAVAEAKARISEISAKCEKHKMDKEFTQRMIDGDLSVSQVNEKILDKLEERQAVEVKVSSPATITRDGSETKKEGLVNALSHRMGGEELTENGRRFRNLSLIEMAAESEGLNRREHGDEKIISRAFHSTSDFSSIVLDAQNKKLAREYKEMAPSYTPFVEETSLRDFKQSHTVGLGEVSDYKKTVEGGDVKHGTVGEKAELIQLETYTNGMILSRQLMINDDTRALNALSSKIARAARRLEAKLVYGLINSNAKLKDGKSMFHADHGNYNATASALGLASISAAKTKMRKQKIDDVLVDIVPRICLVPVELEDVALQYFAEKIIANEAGKSNPHHNKFQVIADPRLTSALDYYFIASKAEYGALIELARLNGEGPKLNAEAVFGKGLKIESVYDIAAGFIDHRLAFKQKGQ